MIRILNFFCVALMGLTILALYHVSERTRVARVEIDQVTRRTAEARAEIGVLQAEWERVAGPARIQKLAEEKLGMSDGTSVQLSSFEQLPRRGDEPNSLGNTPLGNTPLRNASVVVPAAPAGREPAIGQAAREPAISQISDRSGF